MVHENESCYASITIRLLIVTYVGIIVLGLTSVIFPENISTFSFSELVPSNSNLVLKLFADDTIPRFSRIILGVLFFLSIPTIFLNYSYFFNRNHNEVTIDTNFVTLRLHRSTYKFESLNCVTVDCRKISFLYWFHRAEYRAQLILNDGRIIPLTDWYPHSKYVQDKADRASTILHVKRLDNDLNHSISVTFDNNGRLKITKQPFTNEHRFIEPMVGFLVLLSFLSIVNVSYMKHKYFKAWNDIAHTPRSYPIPGGKITTGKWAKTATSGDFSSGTFTATTKDPVWTALRIRWIDKPQEISEDLLMKEVHSALDLLHPGYRPKSPKQVFFARLNKRGRRKPIKPHEYVSIYQQNRHRSIGKVWSYNGKLDNRNYVVVYLQLHSPNRYMSSLTNIFISQNRKCPDALSNNRIQLTPR